MITRASYWKEQIGVAREFAPHAPMEAVERLRVVDREIRDVLLGACEDDERAELLSLMRFCRRTLNLYERQLEDWQRAAQQRAGHFDAEEMAALTAPISSKV